MANDIQNSWYSGIQKKYAMIIAIGVAVCVFALAWLVCSLEYNNKKQAVMAAHQEVLESWVSGTVQAVSLWSESLEAQAQRVSGSEMYRLFASELSEMDERTSALINESDSGLMLPDDATAQSEQVPLIRNLLLDFMTFSGLLDVRIVSPTGQTLLSAMSRPTPITSAQQAVVVQAIEQRTMAFAPVRASVAGLVLDAADPMSRVMSEDGSENPVAALLITTPVTGQVAQFLARDLRQNNLRPHLLQKNNGAWEEVRVQASSPVPVDAALIGPESLSASGQAILPFSLRPALSGADEVYSYGANVPGMDWWVVLEIPASVVDSQLRSLAGVIYGIGALVSVGAMLGLALLWWVLVGRQQRIIAEKFESLYTVIAQQKRLLDSVNVSLDVGLFMSDVNGKILVGNRAFAEIANTDETKLAGNTLSALFDGTVSGKLLDSIRSVSDSDENATSELTLPQADGEHLYRVTLFPFVDDADAGAQGAVAILQDITEFRRSSEKRRMQQIHTMDAFVRAIEGVDPYLAGHSKKMAELGGMVAERMGLPEADRNTIVQAAGLSQVGKLFVPRELLGKSGKLTEEEQAEMAKVPEHAYRVLKDIDFDLPVPQAVYEMYESMDGSGDPQHLKGDEINVHARVLAVVNAFCAMVSPRSYRKGMSIEDAVSTLKQDTASFDPQVVEMLDEVLRTPEGAHAMTQA